MIRRFDSEDNRWQLWPIGLRWGDKLSSSRPFSTHGWRVGTESVPVAKTSFGCMPGFRKVFGQTLHLWRLKICFGRVRR